MSVFSTLLHYASSNNPKNIPGKDVHQIHTEFCVGYMKSKNKINFT